MRAYSVSRLAFVAVYTVGASLLFGCGPAQSDGREELGGQNASVDELPVTNRGATTLSREEWKLATRRSSPPPTDGCFTKSYPSTEWKQVPCATPPERTQLPITGLRDKLPIPAAVGTELAQPPPGGGNAGGGNDYIASATGSNAISEVVGEFPAVSGLTEEWDGKTGKVNMYDLQINSNFFAFSPACSGANCYAWQQFEYSTTTVAGVFIEYWMYEYGQVGGSNNTCPSGWSNYNGKNPDGTVTCHALSGVTSVPVQSATQLQFMFLEAIADGSGALDYAALFVDSTSTWYTASNFASKLYLYAFWNQVEWNVVGDWNFNQANFNRGTSIEVQPQIYGPSGVQCIKGGTTGETNNLTLSSSCTSHNGYPNLITFDETH